MNERERPMLEAIQARYGGSLSPRIATHSITWQLTGRTRLTRIVNILIRSRLLSAKTEEVVLLQRAIGLYNRPEEMRYLKERLSALKRL